MRTSYNCLLCYNAYNIVSRCYPTGLCRKQVPTYWTDYVTINYAKLVAERGWFAIGYKVIKAKVNTISYEGMKSFASSHKMTISQLIRSAIYRYMKATREEEKIKDFLNNL